MDVVVVVDNVDVVGAETGGLFFFGASLLLLFFKIGLGLGKGLRLVLLVVYC